MSAPLPSTRMFIEERLRATAVRSLQGESAREIAVRLGVTMRTVERYKARLRQDRRLPQT